MAEINEDALKAEFTKITAESFRSLRNENARLTNMIYDVTHDKLRFQDALKEISELDDEYDHASDAVRIAKEALGNEQSGKRPTTPEWTAGT